MANPSPPIPPNKGETTRPLAAKSSSLLFTIYTWISTPVLLLSFILSLIFIDLRNSARRAHYHSDDPTHHHHSRMPAWLHKIIYKYRPYRYVVDKDSGELKKVQHDERGEEGKKKDAGEYYHSHQKKLAKMEMAEAFEVRGVVMVGLGLVLAGLGWAVWKGCCVVWSLVMRNF